MKLNNKKIVEKIINFLLNILIFIFAIILLISIYTGVQTKFLGNNYTDFFGYSLFEVQTGSMADTINAGDWIVVKLTQNVKLNDIVTYELDGEYVTHRVMEVYNGTYVTKGDANNAKDEPVDQNKIIGKVISIWANFGIIRKTLFNPSVLVALIITLFLFDFAFKKNKTNSTRRINRVNDNLSLDIVMKNLDLLFKGVIKKLDLFFKGVMKKSNLITKKIINLKNNKKIMKSTNNVMISKIENTNLESHAKTNNFNEVKESTSKVEPEDYYYYKDEDELDKTSFYRMIPVDDEEVDNKFKESPTKVEMEEYYKDEDELDKTSFYRMIPVDATEVNDTLLEIAENEIKKTEQSDKKKEKVMELEPRQEEKVQINEDENLTNVNLELLKNIKNSRKSKNIIDAAMIIKEEEANEIINILVKDNKAFVNKPTIRDMFMTTYIDARYYDYYDESNTSRNFVIKIEKALKRTASRLINNYHGKDTKYNTIVDIYTNTFLLINNLVQARDSITDSRVKKEFYIKEITKYCINWDSAKIEYIVVEIMKVQKTYADTLEYFLKKLETNMFVLNFNKISNRKDMYGLALEHNISFSKVYSDYIIDKTYTEGIIAEDKMVVLLSLLSMQLIKDMISSNFDRKYILYIPRSLYTKEKKLEKLLEMIDDKYARSNVIVLIKLEDLLNHRQSIMNAKKSGYKFALVFDKESMIKEKDRGDIYLSDYIFVNKKTVNIKDILPFIPEELLDSIIDEDIIDKVGDLGGELL